MGQCKKLCIVIPVLLAVLTHGCAKKQSTSEKLMESDYIQMVSYEPTRLEQGEFLVLDGISYYVDYEKADAVPICSKPDCRHISPRLDRESTCSAAMEYQTIFPYSGRLYGIKPESEGKMQIFISDLDGGNRESLGEFPGGSGLQDFLLVQSRLYYTAFELSEAVPEESGSDIELIWNVYTLDLKTLETEKIITHTGVGRGIYLLGGTKDYQIYSMGDDSEVDFYCLDYNSDQSEKIPVRGTGYQKVIPFQDGFYYVDVSDHGACSVHYYDIQKKEDRVSISEEEITGLMGEGVETVNLQTAYGDGFIFGAYIADSTEKGVFLKENIDAPVVRLDLPDQLEKKDGIQFNGFESETEEGIFFRYVKQVEIEKNVADTVLWYAYIDKNALLSGSEDIQTVIEPKVSSMLNPVDSEGNILN